MLALSLLLSLSISPQLEALEIYKTATVNAPANWTYIYNEDKRWIVEEIALDSAGWPILKSKGIYKDKALAQAIFESKTKNLIKTTGFPEDGVELVDPAGDTLWTVTNQWSWDWEVKYAKWVTTELDSNWWKRHGLATDCADVAYSARWIFARNNGLPMANRLGNGQWFTYKSVKPEWKRLPTAPEWHNDKRFLAALNYFLTYVFTHSLWNDSYPIAISPESLTPGAHHLSLTDASGHTQFVYKVGTQPDEIPVLTLNSTIPREVRDLSEFLFFGGATEGSEAMLRMRWPVWNGTKVGLVPESQMPHYSREQFDPNFVQSPRTSFWQETFFRVNPVADFDLIAQRALRFVADLMRARIQIVEDGYAACSGNRCPEGGAAWELWSTPTRDGRIQSAIIAFRTVSSHVTQPEIIRQMYAQEILTQEGYPFSLEQMILGWQSRLFSSDPNEEPVVRWGVHPRGAAASLAKTFEVGLSRRSAKIAATGTCRGLTCAYGSEKYRKEGTFAEDAMLWQRADFLPSYCASFGEVMCADLTHRLNQVAVTADGRTLGLDGWMYESLFFNSDPRTARERRFRGWSREIGHFVVPMGGLQGIEVFDSKLMLVTNVIYDRAYRLERRLYVMSGTSFTEWNPPPGETLLALDPQQGWIWTYSGTMVHARKIDSAEDLTFEAGGAPTTMFARAGNALLYADQSPIRLSIQGGAIVATPIAPSTLLAEKDGLFLLGSDTGASSVLDLDSGSLFDFPAYESIPALQRASNGVVLARYFPAGGDEILCAAISMSGVKILSGSDPCALVEESGYAIVFRDSEIVKLVFNNWQLVREENLGELKKNQGRVFVTENAAGLTRSFCTTDRGLVTLPALAADFAYYDCNHRFASAMAEGKPWQMIEIATGRKVFEIPGWMQFASAHPDEHLIIASAEREYALMDLDHLEKFSILSDYSLWNYDHGRVDRSKGLLLYKNGQGVWLNQPLP